MKWISFIYFLGFIFSHSLAFATNYYCDCINTTSQAGSCHCPPKQISTSTPYKMGVFQQSNFNFNCGTVTSNQLGTGRSPNGPVNCNFGWGSGKPMKFKCKNKSNNQSGYVDVNTLDCKVEK